jgi:heme/copper-type cytochrome/quinol oxidase subunit 2
MGKLNDFIIQFSVFLVGLISIGLGRIVGAFQRNFDQILSNFLVFGGLLVIICLFMAIIFMWRQNSEKEDLNGEANP